MYYTGQINLLADDNGVMAPPRQSHVQRSMKSYNRKLTGPRSRTGVWSVSVTRVCNMAGCLTTLGVCTRQLGWWGHHYIYSPSVHRLPLHTMAIVRLLIFVIFILALCVLYRVMVGLLIKTIIGMTSSTTIVLYNHNSYVQ